jgi:predicted Zn-dependent peptidase
MPIQITFRKTGQEVKHAIAQRQQQLQARLDKRNQVLDEFLKDTRKVRSYMVRSSRYDYSHGGRSGYVLFAQDDISSEEKQEIQQLCNRIFEIEQELHRLALVVAHLDDQQVLELTLDDLIGYGFNAVGGLEGEST